MKTSILVSSTFVILSTAFQLTAGDIVQPSPITLSDGSKITFLGTTFGRHHVAPHYQDIGGTISTGNWINSPQDTTVAWIEIEHTTGQWPSYSLLVSDTGNINCITAETSTRCHVRDGVEVHGFLLKAYPRWDKQFILRIASPYGQPLSNDKLLVTNPDWKEAGNPTVEALPQTKSDGDVTVTLTNLVTGAPLPPYAYERPFIPGDPRGQCVRIGFDFKQNGHAATNWHPWVVTLTDSLSNQVQTTMQFQDNEFMRGHWRGTPFVVTEAEQYKGYYFRPGLWPNEPAWNVRIEFTRDNGFDADEILSLTNLPVRHGTQEEHDAQWTWEPGKTNLAMGEYTVNGVKLKLFPPLLMPNSWNTNETRLNLLMRPDPVNAISGMRITLLQATDENGRDLGNHFISAGYNCSFEFTNQKEIKSVNLKFALHRSRFVEFTARPVKF